MTAPTAVEATVLLRDLLAEVCTRLNRDSLPGVVDFTHDPMGDALVALLIDEAGSATKLVTACLLAVHLRPGMADYLADAVDRVATVETDRLRGYRQDHDEPCSFVRLHGECDACTEILLDQRDDAVRDLLFLLGDKAVERLARDARAA